MRQTVQQGHDRLIQAVLDAIAMEDHDDAPRLTDARLRSVIFGHEPLAAEEKRLLARSAATRDRFAWLRHRERARTLAAWQTQGIEPQPLQLLAAADEAPAVAPLRLVGDDYTITLTPVDLDGQEWHMTLEIMPALRAANPTGFRLVDSDGLVWLAGHPDVDDTISGYWTYDESLWERVHRVSLQIMPM